MRLPYPSLQKDVDEAIRLIIISKASVFDAGDPRDKNVDSDPVSRIWAVLSVKLHDKARSEWGRMLFSRRCCSHPTRMLLPSLLPAPPPPPTPTPHPPSQSQ